MVDMSELMERHVKKWPEFYANGRLTPEKHWRTVENIKRYAEDAGVKPEDLYGVFKEVCTTQTEYDFMERFLLRRPGQASGMYYTKKMDPPVRLRMRAIGGACLGNDTKSKMIPQGRLFDYIVEGYELDPYRIISLPDLFHMTNNLSEGLRRSVATMFMDRSVRGLPIVLGVLPGLKKIAEIYGETTAEIIEDEFIPVE